MYIIIINVHENKKLEKLFEFNYLRTLYRASLVYMYKAQPRAIRRTNKLVYKGYCEVTQDTVGIPM